MYDPVDLVARTRAAQEWFVHQRDAVNEGRGSLPLIPGYNTNIPRLTPIYSAYPLYGPPDSKKFGNTQLRLLLYGIMRDISAQGLNGYDKQLILSLKSAIESSLQAGILKKNIADTLNGDIDRLLSMLVPDAVADAFQQLMDNCKRFFPQAFDEYENLRGQAARHFVTQIPQAQHREMIAFTDRTSETASAIVLAACARQKKVILPVPYFFAQPEQIVQANSTPIPVDTKKKNGYKLTPDALEAVIKQNGITKESGNWLILNNPNNVTMALYTREELLALAEVIARYRLNVVVDELYANVGVGEHVSLASLDVPMDDGTKFSDHIITVSGNSKQTNYMTKFGIICAPASFMGIGQGDRKIRDVVERSKLALDPMLVQVHAEILAEISEKDRQSQRTMVAASYRAASQVIARVNDVLGKDANGQDYFILSGSESGHLGTLSVSQDFCKKTGIQSSLDLQQFLLATTGIHTHQMEMMGIEDPIVRINFMAIEKDMDAIERNLTRLVGEVNRGEAPPMDKIREAFMVFVSEGIARQAGGGKAL